MIYAVGIGPGDNSMMTAEAVEAINRSDIVIGYKTYTDLIEKMTRNKTVLSNGMKAEVDRVKKAVELSKSGHTVSVVSSGDPGVYGMAGLILEMADGEDIEVVCGVTAASAAAALLGAPIMHDWCCISLSDLMTPLDLIYKRVELSSQADFVICFYNPRSKGRPDYLREAFRIIQKYRNPDTPVGIVRNAGRYGAAATIAALNTADLDSVDMVSTVIVGNSSTYVENGRMITRRGYTQRKESGK